MYIAVIIEHTQNGVVHTVSPPMAEDEAIARATEYRNNLRRDPLCDGFDVRVVRVETKRTILF